MTLHLNDFNNHVTCIMNKYVYIHMITIHHKLTQSAGKCSLTTSIGNKLSSVSLNTHFKCSQGRRMQYGVCFFNLRSGAKYHLSRLPFPCFQHALFCILKECSKSTTVFPQNCILAAALLVDNILPRPIVGLPSSR